MSINYHSEFSSDVILPARNPAPEGPESDKNSSSSMETLGIPTLNSSGTSSVLQDKIAGGRQSRRPQEGESQHPG